MHVIVHVKCLKHKIGKRNETMANEKELVNQPLNATVDLNGHTFRLRILKPDAASEWYRGQRAVAEKALDALSGFGYSILPFGPKMVRVVNEDGTEIRRMSKDFLTDEASIRDFMMDAAGYTLQAERKAVKDAAIADALAEYLVKRAAELKAEGVPLA
jgi:hypothetical protein